MYKEENKDFTFNNGFYFTIINNEVISSINFTKYYEIYNNKYNFELNSNNTIDIKLLELYHINLKIKLGSILSDDIKFNSVIQDPANSIFYQNIKSLYPLNYNSDGLSGIIYSLYNYDNKNDKYRLVVPNIINEGESIIGRYKLIKKNGREYNELTNIIHTNCRNLNKYKKTSFEEDFTIIINNYINTIFLFITLEDGNYAKKYNYNLNITGVSSGIFAGIKYKTSYFNLHPSINLMALIIAHKYLEDGRIKDIEKINYIWINNNSVWFNEIYNLLSNISSKKIVIKNNEFLFEYSNKKEMSNIRKKINNKILDLNKDKNIDKDIIKSVKKEIKKNDIVKLNKLFRSCIEYEINLKF